ncbi:MAG: AraC family ligand binding domain-containing protein, partial [Lentisphaerae bacterium]|nr:AraC family ligand binding domain-containing protein [Lentisphaerota bacterium]
MENAYFSEDDLSVLLSPSTWHLASSKFAEVHPVTPDRKYLEWLGKNRSAHQHQEVMLTLSGTSYFTLDGKTFRSRPGTIFLVDANEKHDFYCPPFEDNVKQLWFLIVNKTIFVGTPYCKTKSKRRGKNDFSYAFSGYSYAGLSLINAWNELSVNEQIDKKFLSMAVKNAFAGLVLELCKAGYNKVLGLEVRKTELHHQTVINAIIEHIRDTGGKELDLAKLAHIAGYSKFHFAKIFKSVTGRSVLTFINSC